MNKYVASFLVGVGMLTTGIGAVAINDHYQNSKIHDLRIKLYDTLDRTIDAANKGIFFLDKEEDVLAVQELERANEIGSDLNKISEEIKYRERYVVFFRETVKKCQCSGNVDYKEQIPYPGDMEFERTNKGVLQTI